ncbi:MAG: bacterioferritin [Alphaproteobacteria bacterium]
MGDAKLIEGLNRMLTQEYACAIRYATHAAIITGPYAQVVSARLKEIAGDEARHAKMLRDRIVALGGAPTMDVSADDLKPATTLEDIIKVNMAEEHAAIRGYRDVLKRVPSDNVILLRTIEDIIRDEQEHLEELEALRP